MPPVPPATEIAHASPSATDGQRLAEMIRAGDLDAAIDAGLMTFADGPGPDPAARALILDTRRRLLLAWEARDRYRARAARLARRAAEREARRRPVPDAGDDKPALPPAAAAALARARARAGRP